MTVAERPVGEPRLAYRVLEARATVTTILVLLALAGAAWWLTVDRARDMAGVDDMGMKNMVTGLSSVGLAMMPFSMNTWVFMAMWITMMVAMMFPTIAPIVLLHQLVMRRAGAGLLPTGAFVGGYLLVWTAAGFVPLGILLTFRDVAHETSWVAPTSGIVLIVAGAYQFTRWKAVCLNACVSPMTFLATHRFGQGTWGAVRTGASHGMYCLGCCWALMTVLFVVGLMNLTWMAAIAAIFLIEKHWRRGPQLAIVIGWAVIAFGLAVLIHPAVLSAST